MCSLRTHTQQLISNWMSFLRLETNYIQDHSTSTTETVILLFYSHWGLREDICGFHFIWNKFAPVNCVNATKLSRFNKVVFFLLFSLQVSIKSIHSVLFIDASYLRVAPFSSILINLNESWYPHDTFPLHRNSKKKFLLSCKGHFWVIDTRPCWLKDHYWQRSSL